MKLAALVSGGKDGIFATHIAKEQGNEISCILTVNPESDESMLCHHPNTTHVKLQATSMNVPSITAHARNGDENDALAELARQAKKDYDIKGIVHGGICSVYQKKAFEDIAKRTGLKVIAPLWGREQTSYMRELVKSGFKAIIVAVSAGGLEQRWLGQELTIDTVSELEGLAAEFGFNPSFEGGEAETFVLDCPLFCHPIKIIKSQKAWDGYRGRFEIQEARLDKHA